MRFNIALRTPWNTHFRHAKITVTFTFITRNAVEKLRSRTTNTRARTHTHTRGDKRLCSRTSEPYTYKYRYVHVSNYICIYIFIARLLFLSSLNPMYSCCGVHRVKTSERCSPPETPLHTKLHSSTGELAKQKQIYEYICIRNTRTTADFDLCPCPLKASRLPAATSITSALEQIGNS